MHCLFVVLYCGWMNECDTSESWMHNAVEINQLANSGNRPQISHMLTLDYVHKSIRHTGEHVIFRWGCPLFTAFTLSNILSLWKCHNAWRIYDAVPTGGYVFTLGGRPSVHPVFRCPFDKSRAPSYKYDVLGWNRSLTLNIRSWIKCTV